MMTKWAVELVEYDISYKLRTAIKALALADFIAKRVAMYQIEANVARIKLDRHGLYLWTGISIRKDVEQDYCC